ncbi:MAG: substrate-binding domain-containing protein [Clostridiaceae bacterium]|nr:substrate-binding domain-containing protein [Clostridiaceae bacterium]
MWGSKKYLKGLILGLVIIICATIGYYYKIYKNNDEKKDIKRIKIGLSMDSLVVERWQTDRDVFMAKVKELGGETIVQNAGNNSNEQINQIKYLIAQEVDVLVIVPNDRDALAPVVSMAQKKGIEVISYDRIIRKGNVDLYVTFDNERVGELMGEALEKKVPKGNYIIINGNKQDYNAIEFNQGYMKVLNSSIKSGDIKIVDEVWSKDWNEDEAIKSVEETIAKNIKIDGIVAANDTLAQAVIKVLSEHRLAGKVVVVGQDSDLAACQRVVEGLQLMTVYKPIVKMAQDAAEAAVKMAKGKKINSNGEINDGLVNVPVLREYSTEVTKDNMVDIVVRNNFHRLEDIYRNIPQLEWPKDEAISK